VNSENAQENQFSSVLFDAVANADLPYDISSNINREIKENPGFIMELFSIMQSDPYLWILVDKENALPDDYEPLDLIELTNRSYRINRQGLLLRSAAAESLEEMAAAARQEGLTLLASSAYRSYSYQTTVYQRNVTQMGQEAADRESARQGHSQHQLGLVVDFGSITDAFAQTPESRWLAANASRFGWSLSYPDGYEEVTGYRWESWHYRYVGIELAEFIDIYFNGIQQYALRFIHEWNKLN
jgi:D-alanyl-D-alanine carboxypeptidase